MHHTRRRPTYFRVGCALLLVWAFAGYATAQICDIQLNKTSFVNGDQVIAQVLRVANPTATPVAIEFKLWFEVPEGIAVAASNLIVPLTATTVRALESTSFSLPAGAFAGVPALVNQPTTVRFTNTGAVTPTVTITAPNGTATGPTTFGSCIFTITSSTIPGVTVGQQITVNPCQYVVQTGGVQATGQATTVQILLQLGLTPSAAQQAQVSIHPTTGVVTVNNINTGQAVTLQVDTLSISFARGGADGSVVLSAGFDQNLGPLTLATVEPQFPRGLYAFNCRFLDPVTGGLLAEDLNPFDIR